MIFISDFVHSGGALVGLAIGDALGAPLEGRQSHPIRLTEMENGGIFPRRSGEITDDTLQARALADSLAMCRKYQPYDILRRLINDYSRNPYMYGPTSSSVFEMVMKGVDYDKASRDVYEKSGGRSNGSVMRGPPLGIFYCGPGLEAYSTACSRLTHYHPVACACSAWINRMVSDLCRGHSREDAFRRAAFLCREKEVSEVLGSYRHYEPVPGLDALDATHAALACFMDGNGFRETMISAVNLGGDADTVGAVTGSLAGSYYGLTSIPPRWLADLRILPGLMDTAVRLWMVSEK